MQDKFQLTEEETLYLPSEMKDGILKSGLLVSDGTLVVTKSKQETAVRNEPKPMVAEQQVEENSSNQDEVSVESEGDEQRGNSEEILVLDEHPSVDEEAEGESFGGSAEEEGTQDISVEGIKNNIPKSQLVQAIQEDKSLELLRKLAELGKEGYHLEDDILFRTRLNSFGQPREQICLPEQYSSRCLKLAHNKFGHQERNKICSAHTTILSLAYSYKRLSSPHKEM